MIVFFCGFVGKRNNIAKVPTGSLKATALSISFYYIPLLSSKEAGVTFNLSLDRIRFCTKKEQKEFHETTF